VFDEIDVWDYLIIVIDRFITSVQILKIEERKLTLKSFLKTSSSIISLKIVCLLYKNISENPSRILNTLVL